MNNKIVSIAVLIIAVSIGYYFVFALPKLGQQNTENNTIVTEEVKHDTNVQLYYNNSTGELYPTLPNGVSPHTCVWTIWGDHGSDTKVVTDEAFITSDTDETIKMNKFLPPRVPIYMTCIDWQNNVYRGSMKTDL